ncbi:MAG: phosphocholine cytidylyltransferase family protein [Polyangiaceae bacterium]|nr:phosphocholine cytidylyltransferase family protein [Polyangiaceae bacterium]MCE7889301.1 phosphocholine cytidylyltransferase family protein [Sorangiineae bacterium PRO1]MCL4751349.1 phosphocholine cytidylyltransferase family protein [Myxococcales bacterium]
MEVTRTAVLLVAGIGSRLRPLTDDRPKALVEVGGETILGRALRLLAAHGVGRVVLATGYREEALRSALAGSPFEVIYCRNERFDSTQNAVSLALCASAVDGRAFFKLDGDVMFRPEVLARLDACEAPLAVAVDRSRRADAEAMKFRLGDGDRIEAFGKGIDLDAAAGESIGIERVAASISPALFAELARPESAALYYEDVYSKLIAAGRLEARAVEVGDLPWTEVDDPIDLGRARALFA